MRFVFTTALKDLRRLRRDPVGLITWIGVPVLAALLLILIFGRQAPAPRGTLLVADEDQTVLSSLLPHAFDRGPLSSMVAVERVLQNEGRARMERGEASALLVVPKGFAQAVLRAQRFEISLITNPSQTIVPKIIEETLAMATDLGFYAQQIAGDQLRLFAGDRGALPDADLVRSVLAIRRLTESVPALSAPPLIALNTTVVEPAGPPPVNFAALLLIGMLFLSVLFLTAGLSSDIWKEREQGGLRRLAAAPRRVESFLVGKAIAACTLVAAVGAVAIGFGDWLAPAPAAALGLAWAWVVCSGAAIFAWTLVLQLTASSQRAAHILTNLVTLPLGMLGGSFFPFESMPATLAAIGRWTPNGWALTEFKAMAAGSIGTGQAALDFGVGVAAAALAFWIAALKLRTRLSG